MSHQPGSATFWAVPPGRSFAGEFSSPCARPLRAMRPQQPALSFAGWGWFRVWVTLRRGRHTCYIARMRHAVRTVLPCVAMGTTLNLIAATTIVLLGAPPSIGLTGYVNLVHRSSSEIPPRVIAIDVTEAMIMPHGFITHIDNAWAYPASSIFHPPRPEYRTAVASGWPFASFVASVIGEIGDEDLRCENGVLWPPVWLRADDAHGPPADVRVIPYGVIWPGFLSNTSAYSALLWLCVGLPRVIRTRRRHRRRQCLRCAYPREDHVVCPECGTTHKCGMDVPTDCAMPRARAP